MNKKLTASERLKIKDKQFYNSLTEKQKRQIDRIKSDSFMEQTTKAQKLKYGTSKMKAPEKKMKGVTLERRGVTLKYKAGKKKKKK